MQKINNPLDKIKIASPCSADWNKMYGDNRKRFCGECKLNVYNLSEMTREEAENFLVNSEGNVCVKFYRQDGTVLTQNCPVGWQAVKKRISRVTTAFFSTIIGLFVGVFTFNQINNFDESAIFEKVVIDEISERKGEIILEEGAMTYKKPVLPTLSIGRIDDPVLSMGKPSIKYVVTKKKNNR